MKKIELWARFRGKQVPLLTLQEDQSVKVKVPGYAVELPERSDLDYFAVIKNFRVAHNRLHEESGWLIINRQTGAAASKKPCSTIKEAIEELMTILTKNPDYPSAETLIKGIAKLNHAYEWNPQNDQ